MNQVEIGREHKEKTLQFQAYAMLLDNKIKAIDNLIECIQNGEDETCLDVLRKEAELCSLKIERWNLEVDKHAKEQFAKEYKDRLNTHKKIIDDAAKKMTEGNHWVELMSEATKYIKDYKVPEEQRQKLQNAVQPFLQGLINKDFYDDGELNAHFVNCCTKLNNELQMVLITQGNKENNKFKDKERVEI